MDNNSGANNKTQESTAKTQESTTKTQESTTKLLETADLQEAANVKKLTTTSAEQPTASGLKLTNLKKIAELLHSKYMYPTMTILPLMLVSITILLVPISIFVKLLVILCISVSLFAFYKQLNVDKKIN